MGGKFVILPFSLGCVPDQSCIAVSQVSKTQKKKKKTSAVSSDGLIYLQKTIIKSLKGLFAEKEEVDEEVEELMVMEIGYPTNVKHVGDISWDGSSSINS